MDTFLLIIFIPVLLLFAVQVIRAFLFLGFQALSLITLCTYFIYYKLKGSK